MSRCNYGRRTATGPVFLKFLKVEHDDVMLHRMVSTRIELPEENFREVEKALKPLGITFRSPNR